MSFTERLGKEILFFDGAMGTILQKNGLKAGELPEVWNITHRSLILDIHKSYINAGADVITTNTFGANELKLADTAYSVEQIVKEAVGIAKEAANSVSKKVYIALDLGPTGKLLEPYGELPFEKAYGLYAQQVKAGACEGADFILLETMGDLYEIKAAVLAAKENCDLPIVVSMIFNEKGQLLTGADIKAAIFTLEGLGVDGIGLNCGLGPAQMIDFVKEALKYTSLPLVVNPNAGLPECVNGVTSYNVDEKEFSEDMKKIVELGASAVGGCCGTTPGHIKSTVELCKALPVLPVTKKHFTAVTSYSKTAVIGEKPIIIGERINPTGKKKLKEALVNKDFDYIVSEAVKQVDKKAMCLMLM
jgi:5-methyltetrahydrofolate--homocysteine methyltransferase